MEINVSAKQLYEHIKKNGWILFETVVGSHAYGTATEKSDTDIKFIYVLPDYLYGYIPQIHVNKDFVGFELSEFLKLIVNANPTLLELVSMPEDCIIYKHTSFDLITKNKDMFITKKCADSFGNYSKSQIKKAFGQDKMINWEKQKITRKNPIDFCFVVNGYGTKPLKKYLKENGFEQKFCGIVNIPNARDLFALFYDQRAHFCFAHSMDEHDKEYNKKIYKEKGESLGLGYKGIEKEGGSDNAGISNNLRLSSIPKGEEQICVFSYNKDAYTQHCNDYNKYQKWLKERNMSRWIDVKNHDQKIDGKNMLHCMRLIDMAMEIASGKGINVRRENAKELLDIKMGNIDLKTLMQISTEKIMLMEKMFLSSSLPSCVDIKKINDIEKNIRQQIFS